MKPISLYTHSTSTTSPLEKKKAQSRRAELIGFFTDKINEKRDGVKYKKLTHAFMGVRLSHLSLQDLHFLKSVCSDSEKRNDGFGKTFWYSIQTKTQNNGSK